MAGFGELRVVVKNTFLEFRFDHEVGMKRSLSDSDMYKALYGTEPAFHAMEEKSAASPPPDSKEPSTSQGLSAREGTTSSVSASNPMGGQVLHTTQKVVPPSAMIPTSRPPRKLERAAEKAMEVLFPRPAISIGTKGHPVSCAEACKYINRKGGCRDGSSCPKCHACLWTRKAHAAQALLKSTQEVSIASASTGSQGHPYNCNEACKYVKRKGGCVYGTKCKNCHLCHWQRRPKMQLLVPSEGATSSTSEDSSQELKHSHTQLLQMQNGTGLSFEDILNLDDKGLLTNIPDERELSSVDCLYHFQHGGRMVKQLKPERAGELNQAKQETCPFA